MTLVAEHVHVSASQGKARHRVVIEGGTGPRGRRVALLASGWESCGHVIRIFRRIEIRLMAIYARRWRAFVLAVHVTLRTNERLVGAGQRESRRRVIEHRSSPSGCAVAL